MTGDDYRPIPIDGDLEGVDPIDLTYDTALEALNAAAVTLGYASYEAFIESKAGACPPPEKED